jgi:hypothetical protein
VIWNLLVRLLVHGRNPKFTCEVGNLILSANKIEICGHQWIAFCIDITQYINELNITPQEGDDLVHVMFDKIRVITCQRKL